MGETGFREIQRPITRRELYRRITGFERNMAIASKPFLELLARYAQPGTLVTDADGNLIKVIPAPETEAEQAIKRHLAEIQALLLRSWKLDPLPPIYEEDPVGM